MLSVETDKTHFTIKKFSHILAIDAVAFTYMYLFRQFAFSFVVFFSLRSIKSIYIYYLPILSVFVSSFQFYPLSYPLSWCCHFASDWGVSKLSQSKLEFFDQH